MVQRIDFFVISGTLMQNGHNFENSEGWDVGSKATFPVVD
jgi:hypothetical protein